MNPVISSLMIVSGGLLASRLDCYLTRLSGAALIAGAFVISAAPALAQEHILAVDNGEVRCQASKSDLTRIALKDDQFVAVSRVQSGIEAEDFSIVHEPTRGDIYLSVPGGYTKPNISFFGTTQKGYVYKFDCQVSGDGALQVFVANADIEHPQPQAETLQAASLDDRAVGLVRAMFEQRPVTGFEISDAARAPREGEFALLSVTIASEISGPGDYVPIRSKTFRPGRLGSRLMSAVRKKCLS